MWKDFSHNPGEHAVTQPLQCWDNGVDSLRSVGMGARLLQSLSMEGGADKAIIKNENISPPLDAILVSCEGNVSLQGQYYMSTRQVDHHGKRYPVSEGIICAEGDV